MEKLIKILESLGIPFAYDHFAEGEGPDPPFICYLSPGDANFSADGIPYYRADSWAVELYTDRKNPETERLVEGALEENGINYSRTEVWIESERLYEVRYAFGLASDAETEGSE